MRITVLERLWCVPRVSFPAIVVEGHPPIIADSPLAVARGTGVQAPASRTSCTSDAETLPGVSLNISEIDPVLSLQNMCFETGDKPVDSVEKLASYANTPIERNFARRARLRASGAIPSSSWR